MQDSFTAMHPFRSLLSGAALLAAGLLLDHAAPTAWAQFGGQFISATPQTPVTIGQPLDITVLVHNDTGNDWTPGELGASWLTQMDEPSWIPGATPITFSTSTTVPDGETASMIVSLNAASLPDIPGTYSVRLNTAFNFIDVDFILMVGNPKTVQFTMISDAANRAPVIGPIADQAVVVTNRLSFAVPASDPDSPPQTLTFNLETGAPPDARIDANSGLFTWTPPAGETPRTNQISVRVTDNGSPPLSATNTFQVVVLAPPRFSRISSPTNGVVVLVWPAFPGKTYQVDYKASLDAGPWTSLSPNIVADGPIAAVTNNLDNARQRFYRLALLD